MSRALDRGLKEVLEQGNHRDVYNDLAALLAAQHSTLLEIEFLPKSHELPGALSFLQDEHAVAIPKVRLVQAFIHARRELQRCSANGEVVSPEEAMKATSVMLLMDSEHLTAANTRKRIITKALRVGERGSKEMLQHEKFLVDSLLTSRLHRHTKSPTLWSHRRWLLQEIRRTGTTRLDPLYELDSVILISAERHPRNYYAWWHARHLVLLGDIDPKSASNVAQTKKWCFSHHNDVSGWSFLTFLLDRNPSVAVDVFVETLHLAKRFLWRNEAVWYFLRNMMLFPAVAADPSQHKFEETWTALRHGAQEDNRDAKILDEAMNWVQVYVDAP